VADQKRTRATSFDQFAYVNLLFDEEEIEGSPNSWGTPWSGSGPLHRELSVSLLGSPSSRSAGPAACVREGRSFGIANDRNTSNCGHRVQASRLANSRSGNVGLWDIAAIQEIDAKQRKPTTLGATDIPSPRAR
jgi:hypothetical protein